MIQRMLLSVCITLSLASCAMVENASKSPLCGSLLKFAASAKPHESKIVRLESDWGSFKKECTFYGDSDGEKFCQVLMQFTSSEFMNLNVQRLAKCAGASLDTSNLMVNELIGNISIFEIEGLHQDIELELSFSFGSDEFNDFIELMSINEPIE